MGGGRGGRRATGAGSISMGIPREEKDKGPNKGDILNGAVSWTRDLMWALYIKHQQEAELAEYITNLGGTFPFEHTGRPHHHHNNNHLRPTPLYRTACQTNTPLSLNLAARAAACAAVP